MKYPRNIHLKIPSALVVCCKFLLTLFNKVKYRDKQCGPRSEQSDLGLHCLFERLIKHFSRRHKQTTFVVIGVLRVSPYVASQTKNVI